MIQVKRLYVKTIMNYVSLSNILYLNIYKNIYKNIGKEYIDA